MRTLSQHIFWGQLSHTLITDMAIIFWFYHWHGLVASYNFKSGVVLTDDFVDCAKGDWWLSNCQVFIPRVILVQIIVAPTKVVLEVGQFLPLHSLEAGSNITSLLLDFLSPQLHLLKLVPWCLMNDGLINPCISVSQLGRSTCLFCLLKLSGRENRAARLAFLDAV